MTAELAPFQLGAITKRSLVGTRLGHRGRPEPLSESGWNGARGDRLERC